MPERKTRQELPEPIESRLLDALGLPEADRERQVADLCADHPDHAEAIRSEVRHHERAQRLLAEPVLPADVPAEIGGYRIVDVLGEGGMGTVFLAEQEAPVRRRVALKVIKLGMDSKAVLRRFDAERQALAVMNHDAIARVFDAGTTDRGQPFFVMEYVPGEPLTEYSARRRLPVEERIRLVQQVCRGVQHAHQKGVIHRDLKPGNVLVVEEQGVAAPKIIDFGLARATEHVELQASLQTDHGSIVGTPEYMSPEQADPDVADIDTRTDIYSLGVMLYELLVGELPFSRRAAPGIGLFELLRRIREDDPPKPSTRLGALGDDARYTAIERGTTATALLRALRSDLDWIVLRAIDKDRNRRYESASALAEDLERYLRHEPVEAGPPSAAYRLRKLVRRYRVQFAAACIVLVVLLAGIFGTSTGWIRADRTAAQLQKRTDEFDMLANVELLRAARASEAALPRLAWPGSVPALERWLEEEWARVTTVIPEVEATLAELAARAVPDPSAPRVPDPEAQGKMERLEQQLAALRRAQAVRAGERTPGVVELPFGHAEESAYGLNQLAWLRVSPNEKERRWGEEALALAYARLALEKLDGGDRTIGRSWVLDTLAWAAFANGLDDEALDHSRAAVDAAAAGEKQEYAGYLARLEQAVAKARGPAGSASIEALERRVAEARAAAESSGPRRLPDRASQVLHDALAEFVADAAKVEQQTVARVRARLAWARRIEALSLDHPAAPATWEQAIAAVRAADGHTASELYRRDPPFSLTPQIGLVPIGRNPATGLWEFYHLRSACSPGSDRDPASIEIPRHGPAGEIQVGDDTGIVLVLLPGGRFLMGSQNADPNAPNFDPEHMPYEEPVHEVELAPFFMARHELTQGQWLRLTGASPPSLYGPLGQTQAGPMTWAHPVEQLTRFEAHDVLAVDGLEMPTEAQWEYACRAGGDTPWECGGDIALVRPRANLADLAAKRVWGRNWQCDDAYDDGQVVHAAVGSFAPNRFGLYDVHGNVYEWCRDAYLSYLEPPRPGDGLRHADHAPREVVMRGGSFKVPASDARSAARRCADPAARYMHLGVRAARRVLAPGELPGS